MSDSESVTETREEYLERVNSDYIKELADMQQRITDLEAREKELATANAQLKADRNNTKPRADNNKQTSILDTVSKKLFHNISDEQHNSSQASHLNNAVETVTIKTNTRVTQQITNINEAQVVHRS